MSFKNDIQAIFFVTVMALCIILLVTTCVCPSSSAIPYFGVSAGVAAVLFFLSSVFPKDNEKSQEETKDVETRTIIKDGLHSAFATITLDDGVFDVIANGGLQGDDYPGVDVEFIRPDFNGTNPRVLFELTPENELRCLIWANPDQEDYSHKISFGTISPHDAKENISDDGNTAR